MTDDPAALPDHVSTTDGERLELAWTVGDDVRCVAVLTHPHPLYGGDMDNIVPASLARALPAHGVAAVRCNFRGVGGSSGTHGGGTAEVADVEATIAAASTAFPAVPVVGVGYSFGADVLLAVPGARLAALVAVAPPLAVLPVERLAESRGASRTLVLSPAHDQFRAASEAKTATAGWPDTDVVEIPGADHFMAGATTFVVERVLEVVDAISPRG